MGNFRNCFWAVFILSAAVLCGCATTAKYEKILQTWVGAPEAELIKRWGPPDSVYTVDASTRMLTYYSAGVVSFPGMAPMRETISVNDHFYTTNTWDDLPL